MSVDYKAFKEDWFWIENKHGMLVPFKLNEVQNMYLETLKHDYPEMQAIRENILKGRQFGFSSLITGMFAADFILSELGEIPVTHSDIYSYKDEETDAHIKRFNTFLNSFLVKSQNGSIDAMDDIDAITKLRRAFLRVDNGGEVISKRKAVQYFTQTASAKVSGRGGTKQNLHWSEVAFYPNTEILSAKELITAAEKQVATGYGKIFRETTGNLAGDYFATEYYAGKDGISRFKSRFFAWYDHLEYQMEVARDWVPTEYYQKLIDGSLATIQQCYWHYIQTRDKDDPTEFDKEELREYPSYDYEAFLLGGGTFFGTKALMHYTTGVREPEKKGMYIQAVM